MKKEYLNFRNIRYALNDTWVLSDLSFTLYEKEVVGVLTRDAAEKEALIQLLNGTLNAYDGCIFSDGVLADFQIQHGNTDILSTYVIQERFRLIPYQTVMENLFLSGTTQKLHSGFINWRLLQNQTQTLLDSFHVESIRPQDMVASLTYYQCFILEVLKAVLLKKRVLVLDDLLKHFPINDIPKFKQLLFKIRKLNISILYLSCSYHDAFTFFDRTIIIREGIVMTGLKSDHLDRTSILPLLADYHHNSLQTPSPEAPAGSKSGHPLLELHQFRDQPYIENSTFSFSLKVDYRQILGILEVEGDCVKSFFDTLGHQQKCYGDMILHGKTLPMDRKFYSFYKEVSLIPDCRMTNILFPLSSTRENLTINFPYRNSFFQKRLLRYQNYMLDKVLTKMGFTDLLSDIQGEGPVPAYNPIECFRLAVARCILSKSSLVIMQNPDRCFGDYNINAYYEIIEKLRAMGMSILLFSNNLETLRPVCDKILYLSDGKLHNN